MSWGPRPRSRCWPAPMRSLAEGRSMHQSRHRPAGFPDPRAYRRGRSQGARRRTSRVYAGQRHPAFARGGRGRSLSPPRGRGFAGPGAGRPRRQGHDVLRDPDVRRAGGRDPLPQPRVPDLRERDPVFGSDAGADPVARGGRLLVQSRRGPRQDHAEHPADHHQQPGQSDGWRCAARRARPPGRRARTTPAGRRAQRRNLRRDPLRRRRACQPPPLPIASRPS